MESKLGRDSRCSSALDPAIPQCTALAICSLGGWYTWGPFLAAILSYRLRYVTTGFFRRLYRRNENRAGVLAGARTLRTASSQRRVVP